MVVYRRFYALKKIRYSWKKSRYAPFIINKWKPETFHTINPTQIFYRGGYV